jgi:hypothetical protein
MSELEAPNLVPVGAGETAFDVTEQFRFEERLGNRRAVDGDEWASFARRVRVDVPGDDIFADTALTGEQHFRAAQRDAVRNTPHGANGFALAHEGNGTGRRKI